MNPATRAHQMGKELAKLGSTKDERLMSTFDTYVTEIINNDEPAETKVRMVRTLLADDGGDKGPNYGQYILKPELRESPEFYKFYKLYNGLIIRSFDLKETPVMMIPYPVPEEESSE